MRRSTRTLMSICVWASAIALVFGIGLVYFPKDQPGISLVESFYYTLRLFILEHDLPRFPTSAPLIFIHFLAPLIALSAAGTLISYIFRNYPVLWLRFKREHVIICGVGRTGKLMAAMLNRRGVPVVGVDQGLPADFEEWCEGCKIPMVYGDFTHQPVLEKAGAYKARAIVFTSGDDLANLEGAAGAYAWLRADTGPVRLIWAHIADERLADTAREAMRTRGRVGIRFFDTYRMAAAKMIAAYFSAKIRKGVSEINVLGFGKFGRDLVSVLIQDAGADDNWVIRIVDVRDFSREAMRMARELDVQNRLSFTQCDISDMDLQDRVDRAFFICTDDDIGNLSAALKLSRDVECTHIYVRMAAWPMPAITDQLGLKRGIRFINIYDLMLLGIEDLPGVFGPADMGDLKRLASSG